MAAQSTRRPAGAKRTRDRQRVAHLLTGALLIVYVYLPLTPGSPVQVGVRFLVLPLLALSGIAMWQWPRLRRLARQRAGRP